tara:strand:+ start:1587 stop:1766 length:180 start_codon:yes stop_codon:yes gene_type:complete
MREYVSKELLQDIAEMYELEEILEKIGMSKYELLLVLSKEISENRDNFHIAVDQYALQI